MKRELAKTYDPSVVEQRLYQQWLSQKYFRADENPAKKPYTIVMPPPNITGTLHIGHALNDTLQDILIRVKRMQGYSALWVPGTDHASISTELKIVAKMATEGLTKKDVGREGFLERAWEWRRQYGSRIVEQVKKLGASCDWDRERFTMDEGLSRAVNENFVRLYERGWIYRGEKLINWCPQCQTTISDAEVDHQDMKGHFWHFKYLIAGTDEFLTFATTRPETMLGDTAIAVNPNDERYAHLVGKTVIVPIVNREIPIIADDYVEMDFGTGVVKITPAHDPNDFAVGERHNLPKINIMNDDGSLNQNAGPYQGLSKDEARRRIIEEFKTLGLFVKAEEITHAVSTHERCQTVIEPLIKLQWFVKMEGLRQPALEAFQKANGGPRFYPERFGKVYLHWLENLHDWCISRQLWWGHRIPAYYCSRCGHMMVAHEQPAACPQCGHTVLIQDEDTLDTWFSSALWPFSTLGWPDDTADLQRFYPTDVLVTSYDIILFWVIRMVVMGLFNKGELPFADVLINGLVRDAQGRKMSKSLGNGIDPLEIIDHYGADALRITLVMGSAPGNDSRFQFEKLEGNRNFLNKIWNAARFILMNLEGDEPATDPAALTPADKWIWSRVNRLAKEVTENIDNYDLGLGVQRVYDFIWDEFCDWYIEMAKPRLYNREDPTRTAALCTLRDVMIQALKLLHPFMPFITEEVFLALQDTEETILLSPWPAYSEAWQFTREEAEISLIQEAVKGIRNLRTEMNVPPAKKIEVYVVSDNAGTRAAFETGRAYFSTLAGAAQVSVQADKAGISDDAVAVVFAGGVVYLPLSSLVDVAKERERLTNELKKLSGEVERIEQKLANPGFVSKAPEKVVAEEREKLAKYIGMHAQVEAQLNSLPH